MPVTLARAARADGPALIAAHLASRGLHTPWVQPFTDQAGFDEWMACQTTGASAGYVARDTDTGAVCGVTTFSQIFLRGFRNAYLSYWAIEGFQRRGLMAEALRLTLRQGFDEIGLHRVEANIQPGNHASIALVRGLGFRHEGTSPRYLFIDGDWRDHERFAILAEDALR